MSRFKCEVITFTPYNILKKGLDYKMNFYNNLVLKADPTEDNHVIKKKNLHEALWEEKQRTIVDVVEHYELSTDGIGLTIVDDTSVPSVDEIKLSDVNSKILNTDIHTYAVGEVVVLIPETSHQEKYEEERYAKKEDIPEGSIVMTMEDWNNYADNLEITSKEYTVTP